MALEDSIQEQDIKDLADELVQELEFIGLLNYFEEKRTCYTVIYNYLKNKYERTEEES